MKIAAFVCLLFSCVASVGYSESAHELTSADLAAFLDGVLPLQIQTEDIGGAVIVVVKDGSVLFAKGYGYSDVAKKKPVSVEQTLFRPGSVSKLFTWTAVMQLVEKGKLDLDRDVNNYLDFKIPDAFGKPITLRNLMTHSAGFAETIKDTFVDSTADPNQLASHLKSHVPRRIFPPGSTPAYSNYGCALAGYIVQRVSGKPFAKYIEQSIFQPLEMTHSTFETPAPKSLQPLISNGYNLGSEDPQPFEIFSDPPAGSLSSSGMDMGQFMIAHLQQGRYKDRQILRPETVQLMHSRQLVLDEATNGMALGFCENSRNGLYIIGHGGDTIYFHSDLNLIPKHNLGFYFSQNSAGQGKVDLRTVVWQRFLDRYFPHDVPSSSKQTNEMADAQTVSGSYIMSRRCEGSIFLLPYFFIETVVSSQGDGTIEIDQMKDLNGKPKNWREIKPFIFREKDGPEVVVFKPIPKMSPLRLITADPTVVFDSVPWFRNRKFLIPLTVFTIGIFLLKLCLWPVAAIVRRHYGRQLNLDPAERRLRRTVLLICAMNLLLLAAYTYFVINAFETLTILSSKNDLIIRLFQMVAVIAISGTLLVIYNAYRVWLNRNHGIWAKLQEIATVLACLGFVWLIFQGNLLDFTLRY